MLIDVSRVLRQINGAPMIDTDGEGKAVEAKVKMALVGALINPVQTDKPMQKFQKDELARKIYSVEKEVDLTPEEIVMLKECVGNAFQTVVMGQLWRLLDGKE